MSDLADITRQRRVYGTENDEYAPPAILDTPEELRQNPRDGWWSRPQTRMSIL